MKGFYLLSHIDADGLVGGYSLEYCANLEAALFELRYLAEDKCGAEYDEIRQINRRNYPKKSLLHFNEYFNGANISAEVYEGEKGIKDLVDYLFEILFEESPVAVEYEGKTYYTIYPEDFDPETSDYLDEEETQLAIHIDSLAVSPENVANVNEALEDRWAYGANQSSAHYKTGSP